MTPTNAQERVLDGVELVWEAPEAALVRRRRGRWRGGRAELVSTAEWAQRAQARRYLNLAAALALLILTLPVMLVVALLVKLTSPGPVLFTQTRVGLDRRQLLPGGNWRRSVDYGGRLFKIYKFRTMYVQAGWARDQVWAQPDDPRVTPVGRILRGFRLDELPQLFNVLRGDMNMVGPRPEQPKIFMQLRGEIDQYQRRQRVLPGITGWAQINHHYDASVDDVRQKLTYDLEYVERQSLLHDALILLRTLPVVLLRRGAW